MESGIYCIENRINGKKYVGQSQRLEKRKIDSHKETPVLYKAICKYGIDNFKIYTIELCEINNLHEREMFWIKELKSHVSENGYNVSWGGDAPMRGLTHSKKTRLKISKANTGRKHSLESIEKMRIVQSNREIKGYFKGHNHSSKSKKLMSKNQKGNKNSFFGKTHSEETKLKMSSSQKGKHNNVNNSDNKNPNYGNKRKSTSSVFLGVSFKKRCWQSSFTKNGKSVYIGVSDFELDAAILYDKFIIKNKIKRKLNFNRLIHLINIRFIFEIIYFIKRKIV